MGQGDLPLAINAETDYPDDEYRPPLSSVTAPLVGSSKVAPPGCWDGTVFAFTHPQSPFFRYAVLF